MHPDRPGWDVVCGARGLETWQYLGDGGHDLGFEIKAEFSCGLRGWSFVRSGRLRRGGHCGTTLCSAAVLCEVVSRAFGRGAISTHSLQWLAPHRASLRVWTCYQAGCVAGNATSVLHSWCTTGHLGCGSRARTLWSLAMAQHNLRCTADTLQVL